MTTIRAVTAALATTATATALLGAAPAPPPDAMGAPWPEKTVRTVGKLVMDLPGKEVDSCSAAVVDSPNGSAVATAAHCLANPDRAEKPRAVYFQPGYHHGGGPEAVIEKGWKAKSWEVSPGWDVNKPLESILPHDWAFVRFGERDGRTLKETYGANRVRFGPVEDGNTLSLGYPAVEPYDGESLHYCRGDAYVYGEGEIGAANVGELSLIPCTLTQGVSGGPWIRDYDGSRQAGTVVGVTSVGARSELLGRPFTGEAREVLGRVGGTR